ncbi:hypothetical protein NF867_10730 [Solitalea sp. MAHUQ-68]|uniref:Uncharacterized protein n=1 Tax=Solitalea agri TaxID=2953739 RepID=A0A9X2F289_9SPHI|nr:hypothetical protein [Solitalea agri]MCO4293339.1 hypothetical protein [Solitalea agri]
MGRYKLLNSLFSGKLETFAANKTPCSIIYAEEDNRQKHTLGIITDFFQKNNKDFLRMDNGLEIKLETILDVNGSTAIDFDNYTVNAFIIK